MNCIYCYFPETDRSCSSTDITPQDEDERMFEASDSDDSYIHDSEEHPLPRGIHNPNYPGFQHLAYTLQVGFGIQVLPCEKVII